MEEESPAWYCVRTQLKRERIAAANLREIEDVEVFSPWIKYEKRTRRGPVMWSEPLFPGYLMAKFSVREQGRHVTHTAGVSHILKFGDVVPVVPESFVNELREELSRMKMEDEEVEVERAIRVGDEVEVVGSSFQGLSGQVVEVKPAERRVAVLLEFLGETRPVTVDFIDLVVERAEKPNPFGDSEGL